VSRREEILAVAEGLLEREGPEALTMRRLGAEVGMQAPSLYKHVRGKADIEAGLQERALAMMADTLGNADAGLPALAAAYRSWALAHPQLYALATQRSLDRDSVPAEVEAAAAAPIVRAAGGDEHRARALWALAHGLVVLEIADRFPPGADLDATWAAALAPFLPE
jgi:AcrR family transcriptional regulator